MRKNIIDFLQKSKIQKKGASFIELGGANSCFYESINKNFSPSEYTIIDNNKSGLDLVKNSFLYNKNIKLIKSDILLLSENEIEKADVCFSIGLIEHFSPENTRLIIKKHLNLTKKEGILLISFPTPTWLYHISRSIAESMNMWIFHDERPLSIKEVDSALSKHANKLNEKIIWPIFFTQKIVTYKVLL